jgi:hypothetical protein
VRCVHLFPQESDPTLLLQFAQGGLREINIGFVPAAALRDQCPDQASPSRSARRMSKIVESGPRVRTMAKAASGSRMCL